VKPFAAQVLARIDAVVALPSLSVEAIEGVLDTHYFESKGQSPAWQRYEAGATRELEGSSVSASQDLQSWVIAWQYNPACSPKYGELEVTRYGPVMDVLSVPEEAPEGTISYVQAYRGFKVFIKVRSGSQRLVGVALHK
jgi:hypothetical protein